MDPGAGGGYGGELERPHVGCHSLIKVGSRMLPPLTASPFLPEPSLLSLEGGVQDQGLQRTKDP